MNTKQYNRELYITEGKLYANHYFKLTTKIMPSVAIQRPRLEVDLQS
jgi:hypothetical protein